MKWNRRQLAKAALAGSANFQTASAQSAITHGPFLGHVGVNDVWVWARTPRPGSFRIRYGLSANAMTQLSPPVPTAADRDCSAWTRLSGLEPGTRYYYAIEGSPLTASFSTVPSPDRFRDPETNPRGLFNFSF